MFNIILSEAVKNVDKNKLITYLSVILFTLLFLLQGYTYSYYAVNKRQKYVVEHESMQNYKIYNLGCLGVSPRQAQKLNPDNLQLETAEFYEEIENSSYLKYVGLYSSGIRIKDFKGDREIFSTEESIDEDKYSVCCLYVTPNFHKIESYRIIEGRDFTDEDMAFVEGKPRAVLLGYKYRGIYEIGDILDRPITGTSNESSVIPQLEVIGFLEEDTTVASRSGDEIYDLDNYIVFPQYIIPISEWNNYDEIVVKHSLNRDEVYLFGQVKFLFNPEYEEECKAELQEAINNYSGFAKYYTILDQQQIVEKIKSRTEAVAEFGGVLFVVLMFFSIITVISTVVRRIESNLKDYAIHIAIGASRKDIVMFIVAEMSIILGCSIILGMVATNRMMDHISMPFYFGSFLGVFVLTSLIIIVISSITANITLKKLDIQTMIK